MYNPNRVKELREKLGMTQEELALTTQSMRSDLPLGFGLYSLNIIITCTYHTIYFAPAEATKRLSFGYFLPIKKYTKRLLCFCASIQSLRKLKLFLQKLLTLRKIYAIIISEGKQQGQSPKTEREFYYDV